MYIGPTKHAFKLNGSCYRHQAVRGSNFYMYIGPTKREFKLNGSWAPMAVAWFLSTKEGATPCNITGSVLQ